MGRKICPLLVSPTALLIAVREQEITRLVACVITRTKQLLTVQISSVSIAEIFPDKRGKLDKGKIWKR